MANLTTRQKWALAVAPVVLVGVLVVVIESRQSGRLEPSPTCEDVDIEPGGTRLRSLPPPGDDGPVTSVRPGSGDASAAFRPATAQAVYCDDFADPFVLGADALFGSRLFTYATNTKSHRLPVLSSQSILRSEDVTGALRELPAWSEPGAVWAPSVLERDDDLVLYYTTTHRASGRQCISRATSDDPVGPFVDDSSEAMICPLDLGGAIDPSPFVAEDGTAYLLWKNDGNCCDIPTRLWAQSLSDDRLSVVGPARELMGATQRWEGGLVEAPSMAEHEGTYYLFYSANAWNSDRYAIGYATCEQPTGPCAKPRGAPWLGSSQEARGPGGQELFRTGDGALQMVFHAWAFGEVGYRNGGFRSLFTLGIDFVDGSPVAAE